MPTDPKGPQATRGDAKDDEPKAEPARYRYIGAGDYFPGVPTRDLTDEDVAKLTDEQKRALDGSGLYETVGHR